MWPFVRCCCCCSCCRLTLFVAAQLLQWAVKLLLLLLWAALAAPLQGLPLAAPLLQQLLLLLRIMGRTIVCSAILPSPGLKVVTTPLVLDNQQQSLQAGPV